MNILIAILSVLIWIFAVLGVLFTIACIKQYVRMRKIKKMVQKASKEIIIEKKEK